MLEAVVRMAGATAGAIRLDIGESSRRRKGLGVGLPAGVEPIGVFAVWCGQCAESRNPESECVRNRICGAGESVAGEQSGQICRHVLAVPLRYRGVPVGTLDLHFDEECALPTQTMPLLRATGELIGVALENARLNRENLHASLTGERQMMANEVHDSLAQGLTYMRMRMSMLRDAIKQGDELRAVKYWGDVDDSLTSAHARLRELITCFRSSMDPLGLQHALADIARTFFDRTGITLRFANRAPDLHLPVGREVQAYHIVQEALANVCNHAKAGNVTVSLDRAGDSCEIIVEDDGIGLPSGSFNAERSDNGHYGVAIMRERTRRLGGEFAIEPAAGAGTRVRVRFPVVQQQTERMS
jgi:two-component system nitrate/nitrite sensor histidine kinase NarX